MASDNFNRSENPLASGWSTPAGWNAMKADGTTARTVNTGGSDSAAVIGSAGATKSEIVIGAIGGRDGGPALMDSSGNGYVVTNFDATHIYVFRVDAGPFYNAEISAGQALTYANGDTITLERVANHFTVKQNGSLICTTTDDTTYTSLKGAVFGYADDFTMTSWTDGVIGGASIFNPYYYSQHIGGR